MESFILPQPRFEAKGGEDSLCLGFLYLRSLLGADKYKPYGHRI